MEEKNRRQPDPTGPAADAPRPAEGGRTALKIALPVVILSLGLLGAAYLKNTGPTPKRKPPKKIVSLVEVVPLERSDQPVVVRAMGTVVPSRELVLKPRVSGEIIEMSPAFTPGGFLEAGEEILRIDPTDYELDLSRKRSRVADASSALKLEMGHQEVARREWELLAGEGAGGDGELALRKPHLAKARADLTAARAELKQARLNLERTRITAPFNAVVRERYVVVGSQVSPQEPLAELVGTDRYWVQVSVPVDRLKWITVPATPETRGSPARIRYGAGMAERTGAVTRLLSDLETDGRMARLLVAVDDPLDLAHPQDPKAPLLIGEYVRVAIEGKALSNVFRIPRAALRDGDEVWIAGPDDTLAIRPVEILWRDSETVLLRDGLSTGDRLIVSDLAAPVAGMPVRIAEGGEAPAGGAGGTPPGATADGASS